MNPDKIQPEQQEAAATDEYFEEKSVEPGALPETPSGLPTATPQVTAAENQTTEGGKPSTPASPWRSYVRELQQEFQEQDEKGKIE
jgi:hypothetical protein